MNAIDIIKLNLCSHRNVTIDDFLEAGRIIAKICYDPFYNETCNSYFQ